jgi:glycine/D-amino acid oxidase-like deaminating enzyme
MPASDNKVFEVVVIGAGVAGAAAAYHLSLVPNLAPDSVCVLEVGAVGKGASSGKPLMPHAQITQDDLNDVNKGIFSYARSSGTAVFENPTNAIKMIVNVFPCSAETYISHFGEEGARSYLRLAHKGLELEKTLAKKVLADPATQLTCEGSLYVCLEEDVEEFEREFHTLRRLGAKDVQLWDKARTHATAGNGFGLGIYFPNDAAIDSSNYCVGLLRSAAATGKVRVQSDCSQVVGVDTVDSSLGSDGRIAVVKLQDGSEIRAKWAVIATGGLFMDPNLTGVLMPMWSYLVSIPEPPVSEANSTLFRLKSPNSVNFFSWHFTHDWCLTKGHLRMSGEDHFSSLKPPRSKERCQRMADWTCDKLPYLKPNQHNYEERYGVYSETPDYSPLVGTPSPQSRVCYLLGCNAWGQAVLSFASSLVPSLLGYTEMSANDKEDFRVMNIRRFAFLNAVMDGQETAVVRSGKGNGNGNGDRGNSRARTLFCALSAAVGLGLAALNGAGK